MLDEFSYAVDANPAQPSVLQRLCDNAGRERTRAFVVALHVIYEGGRGAAPSPRPPGGGAAWQEQGLVFCRPDGRPPDGTGMLRADFYPLLKRAGLPQVRFHDLRHSAATLLLSQGIHPKIVSELLGHTTIRVTMDIYSHVLPDMQREAVVAMERLLTPKPAPPRDAVANDAVANE